MTLLEKINFIVNHWEISFEFRKINSNNWGISKGYAFIELPTKELMNYEFREIERK